MEDDAVRDGFQHLRPGTEYDNLYAAALCRAKADWLVGINAAYCEEQRKLKELLVHRENLRPYLAPQEPQTQRRKEQDER